MAGGGEKGREGKENREKVTRGLLKVPSFRAAYWYEVRGFSTGKCRTMHFGKNYLNYTQVCMYVHAGIMFYTAATSLGRKRKSVKTSSLCAELVKENKSKNVRLYERVKNNKVEQSKVELHRLVLQLQLNYCILLLLLHFQMAVAETKPDRNPRKLLKTQYGEMGESMPDEVKKRPGWLNLKSAK